MDPIRPDASQVLIETLASLRAEGRGRKHGPKVEARRESAMLRRQLQAIVAGVSPADEKAMASVRLPVLRCILGEQYGGDLGTDPLFAEVLASVDRDIRERPELDAVFRQAIASLVTRRSSAP